MDGYLFLKWCLIQHFILFSDACNPNNPCYNDGTCAVANNADGYICTCLENYAGTTCLELGKTLGFSIWNPYTPVKGSEIVFLQRRVLWKLGIYQWNVKGESTMAAILLSHMEGELLYFRICFCCCSWISCLVISFSLYNLNHLCI